jgi:hypothetical protein
MLRKKVLEIDLLGEERLLQLNQITVAVCAAAIVVDVPLSAFR